MEGAVVMGVVMGGWRRVGGAVLVRSGVVRTGLAGGIAGWLGFAVGGPTGGDVVTQLSSGVEQGGTRGDTLRRFVQVGGRGGTCWDG